MTLPVAEETVLQNMVQTVETNEEVEQEDLEAFLRLLKGNVGSKSGRIGHSTGSLREKTGKQQKSAVFTAISRHNYFSMTLLIFLAVGVFTGASFDS